MQLAAKTKAFKHTEKQLSVLEGFFPIVKHIRETSGQFLFTFPHLSVVTKQTSLLCKQCQAKNPAQTLVRSALQDGISDRKAYSDLRRKKPTRISTILP